MLRRQTTTEGREGFYLRQEQPDKLSLGVVFNRRDQDTNNRFFLSSAKIVLPKGGRRKKLPEKRRGKNVSPPLLICGREESAYARVDGDRFVKLVWFCLWNITDSLFLCFG